MGLFDKATGGTGLFGNESQWLQDERDKISVRHTRDYQDRQNPFRMLGGALKAHNLKNSPEAQQMRQTEELMKQYSGGMYDKDHTKQREAWLGLAQELKSFNPKGAVQAMQVAQSIDPPKKSMLDTSVEEINGRQVLINNQTGDAIKDLGPVDASTTPSASAKKMKELIDTGVPPSIAQGIAYSAFRVITDQDTGDMILTDLRNQKATLVTDPVVRDAIAASQQPAKPSAATPLPDKPLSEGNREEVRQIEQLQQFGVAVEKANIAGQESILNEIGELLYDKKGNLLSKDIPGFGQTGWMPQAALSGRGKKLRQAVQSLLNVTLKDRSGAAVTQPEMDRFKKEFSSGLLQTDAQLINALQRVQREFDLHKRTLASGYEPQTISTFQKNSGITFMPKTEPMFVIGEDGKYRIRQ